MLFTTTEEGIIVVDMNLDTTSWMMIHRHLSMYQNFNIGRPDGNFVVESTQLESVGVISIVRNSKFDIILYDDWTDAMKRAAIEDKESCNK
jgi:hypothetical protein